MQSTPECEEEKNARKGLRTQILSIGAGFLLASIFAGFTTGRESFQQLGFLTWRKVPCEILSAEVIRSELSAWKPYQPGIVYRFTLAGTPYESESVGGGGYNDYDEAEKVIEKLLQQRTSYCYVSTQPVRSVLIRISNDQLFDLLIPAGFAAYGISIIVLQAFARRLKQLQSFRNAALGIVFGAVACFGVGIMAWVGKMAWQTVQASKWPRLPCAVLFSDSQVLR